MLKLLLLASLFSGFANPPDESKPWAYWWWINGRVDKQTITADLEAMKKLGFGGLLMFDSRGYWDDEDHVVNPKPKFNFMSPEWQDYVTFAIQEAARLGLKFTMNMSSSGGKLDGPWSVGEDAPKRLVYRFYDAGHAGTAALDAPNLPYYHDIAVQKVWYRGEPVTIDGSWKDGGEGAFLAGFKNRDSRTDSNAGARTLAKPGEADARCVLVRFGYTVLKGHDHDVDVLDPKAITGHYNRFQGTLQKKIPGLVGRDKTLAALYSVSWEGSMPTWTGDFESEFRKYIGYDVKPFLPYLAGFTDEGREKFMVDYRRARNDMFRDNFYGTMRDLAHASNIDWYSESGGPWNRDPQMFREADQLEYLAVNDFPQGEFWPRHGPFVGTDGGVENGNGRFHLRGAVSCAHVYGKRIAAAEAFTHMIHHWSVDPAFLKPLGDQAFADGINRLVWHTFTCSPDEFGVPGAEYFAGSHINRNVTWHDDLAAFVGYLGRCQYLLQQGEPVTDIALLSGNRTYSGWGRFRDCPSDKKQEPHLDVTVKPGYAFDLVNDDALAKNPKLLANYPIVYDLRKPENLGKTVPTGKVAPDVQTFTPDITWCHRCVKGVADIYFLTGNGNLTSKNGWVTFRAQAPHVEIWDPVTCRRRVAVSKTSGGRTGLQLDLKEGGSVFVMFLQEPSVDANGARAERHDPQDIDFDAISLRKWNVSFAYHRGIRAKPPAALHNVDLFDFTTSAAHDVKHFSGTATYRTTFAWKLPDYKGRITLSLGSVKTGLAHVYVNGMDCGTVWCRPWTVDIAKAVRPGENTLEIRYTNNWYNRLVGDCSLPEDKRVTKSTVRYWNCPRATDPKRPWRRPPTVFSGFTTSDPLQPSGLMGPVKISVSRKGLPSENPCGLASDRFANWITLGETITFTNSLPADAKMQGVVTDTKGAEVYCGTAVGNAWSWTPSRDGFYKVKFSAVQKGQRRPVQMILRLKHWDGKGVSLDGDFPRDEFAVAVSPSPAREPENAPSRFGFNLAAWSSPRDLEPMREAAKLLGMNSFLRLHYYRWDEMEKKEGEIDWKVPDYTLKYWLSHGYTYDRLIVNVFGTPTWLSTAPESVRTAKNTPWHERPALYAPKDMSKVKRFFGEFCRRYAGIRHVEVWNEPHLPGYSVFWKNSTPEQFVDLLKNAYQGIKEADPTINVVMAGVGMRYLPFYERVVPLGITDWYDMMDTHCGYDMRPFRELERRLGKPSKPYVEGEWHTVLYNCSDPKPPTEEECAFRMLMNFADLLHTVPTRITGFGLNCGTHTPETAKACARQGGIQQVSGLFRSLPMREPRFAAFALRTATDFFSGDVKSAGAWRYGEDGRFYAVAAKSDRGTVAFVWTANENSPKGVLAKELVAAAKGRRFLDWEAHETTPGEFVPRRMYYIVDPDLAALGRGVPVDGFEFYSYNFKGYAGQGRARAGYGAPGSAPERPFGSQGASFAADLNENGLRLRIKTPAGAKPTELRLAIDAAGSGLIDDLLEFRVSPDGSIVKPRTPQLKGDIPSDYSPANVPLTKSTAKLANGSWLVDIWRGDMYPFAYSKGCKLGLSLVLETDHGASAWGGGYGRIVEMRKLGVLVPSGGGRPLAKTADATCAFGDAKLTPGERTVKVTATSGDKGAGFALPISYTPGSTVSYSGKVRGTGVGRLIAACWCSFGKGARSERQDGPSINVSDDWRDFSGTIEMPALSGAGQLNIFSYKAPGAVWEIKDLEVTND